MVREGQRYALLDRSGEAVEDWQVVAVYGAPGAKTRVLLFNVAQPAETMEMTAEDVQDERRFQLVSALADPAPASTA